MRLDKVTSSGKVDPTAQKLCDGLSIRQVSDKDHMNKLETACAGKLLDRRLLMSSTSSAWLAGTYVHSSSLLCAEGASCRVATVAGYSSSVHLRMVGEPAQSTPTLHTATVDEQREGRENILTGPGLSFPA